jgi:hypothetical protein
MVMEEDVQVEDINNIFNKIITILRKIGSSRYKNTKHARLDAL